MKNTNTKKKDTRHGQHEESLVGLSGYVTPKLKAIAQVTANQLKTTMMDLIRDGIIYHATKVGVVKNGMVTPRFASTVNAYVDVYNTRKAQNKKRKENAE